MSPEEDSACPTHQIAKASAQGRLGNQIATYANHISLQWQYGYQLWLIQKYHLDIKQDLKIQNTTFVGVHVRRGDFGGYQ